MKSYIDGNFACFLYRCRQQNIVLVDNKIFNGCEVFDVYEGEHVQEGFKSVAFRIRMQDPNATLTDEAIEVQMANVRSVLKKNLNEVSFREG